MPMELLHSPAQKPAVRLRVPWRTLQGAPGRRRKGLRPCQRLLFVSVRSCHEGCCCRSGCIVSGHSSRCVRCTPRIIGIREGVLCGSTVLSTIILCEGTARVISGKFHSNGKIDTGVDFFQIKFQIKNMFFLMVTQYQEIFS